tara:strand:+ start:63 stop:536 length:474 start_codon:yes stop_codon:yes gene_type:complete
MRKLLYTLLAVSLIFSACEKEDDTPSNTNNNGNNTTNTIADVVGVWDFKGYYDSSGNYESFNSTTEENCILEGFITLQSDGNATWTNYYLDDEISGPCLSETLAFTFTYINSTTLQFAIPSSCGNPTIILPIPTQFKIPSCNADIGTLDGGYLLFEL